MIRVLSALVLLVGLACGGAEESTPAAPEASAEEAAVAEEPATEAEAPALEIEAPALEMDAPALEMEAPAMEAPAEESAPAEDTEASDEGSDAGGMGGMGDTYSPAAPLADSDGSLRGDAANGGQLYSLYCATCHGQGGKGDGPAAPKNPPPADHTDPVRMGGMSDEEMYTVIDKGGAAIGKSPLMASWGPIVQDQGVKDLIAFIRQLSGT